MIPTQLSGYELGLYDQEFYNPFLGSQGYNEVKELINRLYNYTYITDFVNSMEEKFPDAKTVLAREKSEENSETIGNLSFPIHPTTTTHTLPSPSSPTSTPITAIGYDLRNLEEKCPDAKTVLSGEKSEENFTDAKPVLASENTEKADVTEKPFINDLFSQNLSDLPTTNDTLSDVNSLKIIKKRNRDPVNSPDRVRRNIVMYIVNLINAEEGKIAVSRQNTFIDSLNSDWHTFRYAILAQDILINDGMVTLELGQNSIKFEKGFASRLVKTDKFNSFFGGFKPKQPELNMEDVKPATFKNCPNITNRDEIEQQVNKLNIEYFSDIELTHKTIEIPKFLRNVILTRIFVDDGCGRLIQKWGTSYQNIEREVREGLLINGKETVNVDYSSMHPNLLYNRLGLKMPFDKAYYPVMEELRLDINNEDAKNIVKKAMLIMINASSYRGYLGAFSCFKAKGILKSPKDCHEIYNIQKTLENLELTLKDIYDAVIKIHEPIKQYIASNASISLMLEESNIMIRIMSRLAELDILGVPLHDSVICQTGTEEYVKQIMIDEYKRCTGFDVSGIEIK